MSKFQELKCMDLLIDLVTFQNFCMNHFEHIKGHTKCPFLKPMWMIHTSRIRRKGLLQEK